MVESDRRSAWKKFRHLLEYFACRMLNVVVPLLPRRVVVAVANLLGTAVYWLAPNERRVARANLDLAFGETKSPAEKMRIARRTFANFVLVGLDLFWSQRLNARNWRKYVVTDEANEAFGREMLARGCGVIAITFHWGNWEWLGLASGYQGFPLSIITERFQNPKLNALFSQLRCSSGNELIDQKGAMPKVFRALRRGRIVAAVMDTNTPLRRGGIWVNFFGRPVLSTAAIAGLALKTGAAVVVTVCYPIGKGRYRLRYGPEVDYRSSGNEETDRIELTQAMMNSCEKIVREQPEYWLWTYKRWKYRPSPAMEGFPFYSRCPVPREH